MDGKITLRNGECRVVVSPAGGAILSAECEGGQLLQPSITPGLASRVHGREACFPLVPFGNRVEGNSFSFEGRSCTFTPNTDDPLYLHGDGWLSQWEIREQSESTATLAFQREPDDHSPYRYDAEQTISLMPNGFSLSLRVTNRAAEPMPFGVGFHPYFPAGPDTTVSFSAQAVWSEREGHLPGDRQTLSPPLCFSPPSPVPDDFINSPFEAWAGHAVIRQPDGTAIALAASASLTWLQVYKPLGQAGFLCLEPMSHRANAFGGESGCRALRPGQTLQGEIRVLLLRD